MENGEKVIVRGCSALSEISSNNSLSTLYIPPHRLLSSEFGWRCQVQSCARRWLQLVGCVTLLMDASNFRGPDGVGESRVELRRSLRKTRVS